MQCYIIIITVDYTLIYENIHFRNKLRPYNVSALRIRKLPKGLKEWQAFLDLQKKINDFSECCPILELMSNQAMKKRHWDRIAAITSHEFNFEMESIPLKSIMEAPLLEFKEDIEVNMLTLIVITRG